MWQQVCCQSALQTVTSECQLKCSSGSSIMKTTSCTDDFASQLSESFIRELQLQGVPVNNLADCKQSTTMSTSQQFYVDSAEVYFNQNNDGDTQLHLAIVLEKLDLAMLIIGVAPDARYLDIPNDECLTALHCAVLLGQSRIVRKLVLAGANIEAQTNQLDTALHLAVREGHVECLKALVRPVNSAEKEWLANDSRPLPQLSRRGLDARNHVGQTALHIAAIKNDVQLVHELLLSGADVNAKEGLAGKTALHVAIEMDNAEVVYYLAQIPDTLVATNYVGEAAYQIAVESRSDFVETLLGYGAAPSMQIQDDNSMSEDGDYDVPAYMEYTDSYAKAKLVTV